MVSCQNGRVRRAAALAPLVALLSLATPAQALRTHICTDEPAARCGTMLVPIDRSGVVKGRIPIRFAVLGKLGRKAPILALSGGPGQAGVALLDDFADSLRPALRGGRPIVVLDQRGTGYSGVLRCKPLEHSDLLKAGREAAICAKRLGATLLSGDFDESPRAEYPTAVRSALRGDPAPIIRLARRAALVEGGGETDPHFLSATLYATTVCTEETFPWDWHADPKTRLAQARAYVNVLPEAGLYPFDHQTVFHSDEVHLRPRWPADQRKPLTPPGPLPDVPALLVSGADDLRTPLEGAEKTAALLPHSSLVVVPDTGHSVYGSDLTGCSDRALGEFFAGKAVRTNCKHARGGRIRPDGPIPHTIRDVRPAGAPGKR